jgi:hypothetical protein
VGADQGNVQRLQPTCLLEDTVYGRANVLHVRIHLFPYVAVLIQILLLFARITVLVNILAALSYFPISPVYQGLLTTPSATLTSIMACRVYRCTRLRVMPFPSELPTVNTLGPGGNLTIPLSDMQFARSTFHTSLNSEAHSTADESETLGTTSKANTLSFASGTPHDISTRSAA